MADAIIMILQMTISFKVSTAFLASFRLSFLLHTQVLHLKVAF